MRLGDQRALPSITGATRRCEELRLLRDALKVPDKTRNPRSRQLLQLNETSSIDGDWNEIHNRDQRLHTLLQGLDRHCHIRAQLCKRSYFRCQFLQQVRGGTEIFTLLFRRISIGHRRKLALCHWPSLRDLSFGVGSTAQNARCKCTPSADNLTR